MEVCKGFYRLPHSLWQHKTLCECHEQNFWNLNPDTLKLECYNNNGNQDPTYQEIVTWLNFNDETNKLIAEKPKNKLIRL